VIGHVVPEQFARERAVGERAGVALPREQLRLAVPIDIEELDGVHVIVIIVEDGVVVPDLFALAFADPLDFRDGLLDSREGHGR
jgi:hypothetical protein